MKAKRRLNSSNRWAFDERFLAVRFGKRARRLAPGGAQEVEILPVERAAIFGRGEQDQAEQAVVVDQRDADPGTGVREHPFGTVRAAVLWVRPAVAERVELDDPPARVRPPPRNRRLASSSVGGGFPPGQFHAAAVAIAPAASVDQQQPAGRVDDVGEGLDHALAERRGVGPDAADRVGEAQPFGAIIVAMLEQMLGELDLGPAARARRWAAGPSRRRS